jgi:hypothetical protein
MISSPYALDGGRTLSNTGLGCQVTVPARCTAVSGAFVEPLAEIDGAELVP